ncbi:TolC family protein [Piscinibacter terrae]|uniref:TolC family protein n=1 Tax=Piscinibacter terrae TaxID=2496871 RepID=A0A3N7HPT5_9BURK|nr:TolC family protein [Albitalea terrae]RQP22761.1 TolC family protein [Albitalea terrae]
MHWHPRAAWAALPTSLLAGLLLAGCASTAIDSNFADVQRMSRERIGADPAWLTSDDARRQAQADVDWLLSKPLSADDAVHIALAYSPALQAVLADAAASSAAATSSARLPNPVFSFERLARGDGGLRELEITRTLSVPLLDLFLLPARMRQADQRQQQIRLQLAGDVVQAATQARTAWVRAVSARQSLAYVEQIQTSADASAELARRMQAAGNFSKLQRARQEAFHADAVAQLARAQRDALAAREALVRALGLNDTQAASLKLPDRLPDLPASPKDGPAFTQAAIGQRLDVALAQADLNAVAREQGLTRVTSVVNGLQIGAVRKSDTGQPSARGVDLELPLPLFDFGDPRRAQAQAAYMAALNRTAATGARAASQLREAHGAYRSAYDLARHYRDEVVPLRKAIADENLLRYNGMLISVFELLADTREQIGSVIQAIDAQRDFWLADAALQAAAIGRPMNRQDDNP